MRVLAPAAMLMLALLLAFARAQDLLTPLDPGKDGKPKPGLSLTDPAIQKAVRDTLAEEKSDPLKADGQRLRADPSYEAFARKVDEAKVPDCLHEDALKHQPAQIGPIGFVGVYALPFLAAAVIRGKCR